MSEIPEEPTNDTAPSWPENFDDVRDSPSDLTWDEVYSLTKAEVSANKRGRWPFRIGYTLALGLGCLTIGTVLEQRVGFNNYMKTPEALQALIKARGCPSVPSLEISDLNKRIEIADRKPRPAIIYMTKLTTSEALKDGMHTVRPPTKLVEYNPKKETESVSQVLDELNGFTHQYGFKVSLLTKEDDNLKPVDIDKIDVRKFRLGAGTMAAIFSLLPVEFVKMVGLKEVMLVGSFAHDKAGADISSSDGVMHLPLKTFYDNFFDAPYYHELGHQTDYATCGEFGFNYVDTQFTDMNPSDFEYGSAPFVDYHWKGTTESRYGTANMAEDKAEIYRKLFEDFWDYKNHTTLKMKYELLLARIDELAKSHGYDHMADFFIRTRFRVASK